MIESFFGVGRYILQIWAITLPPKPELKGITPEIGGWRFPADIACYTLPRQIVSQIYSNPWEMQLGRQSLSFWNNPFSGSTMKEFLSFGGLGDLFLYAPGVCWGNLLEPSNWAPFRKNQLLVSEKIHSDLSGEHSPKKTNECPPKKGPGFKRQGDRLPTTKFQGTCWCLGGVVSRSGTMPWGSNFWDISHWPGYKVGMVQQVLTVKLFCTEAGTMQNSWKWE